MINEDAPYFSVATATYNAAGSVETLHRSLLQQTEGSWEWLVQDGASVDDTVAIVSRGEDRRVQVRSSPDGGIYEGLNRAVARASGRYVIVLGADDELASPTVLAELRAGIDRAERPPQVVLATARIGAVELFRSTLGPKALVVNTVHHQAAAYRIDEFADFAFDTTARVVADYEHTLRLFLTRATSIELDLVLSRCGAGGVSRTVDEHRLYREMHLLRSKHLPRSVSRFLEVIGIANVKRRAAQRGLRELLAAGP